MLVYHGSDEKVEYPEVRVGKYHKDFSWGFYCTSYKEQAIKWARRNRQQKVLNTYEFDEKNDLKILKFDEMTEEWLDFITSCRSGNLHEYDIVEGPMADDQVWDYVQDFLDGAISREAFWALVRFRHPTHQMSFHTVRALSCLTYEGSEFI